MTASRSRVSRLARSIHIRDACLAFQPFPTQQSLGRGDFAFASGILALIAGRTPDHVQDGREVSQLDQYGANRGLYQGRPDRMRHEIGDDAEHDQDGDQSAKKEQEGHDYVPAPPRSG